VEYELVFNVFDLGKTKDREKFFETNPWLIEDEHFKVFVPVTLENVAPEEEQ
jgi:hypothetical protein